MQMIFGCDDGGKQGSVGSDKGRPRLRVSYVKDEMLNALSTTHHSMLCIRYQVTSSPLVRRLSTKPIIHIPKSSSIHPFGDPSNQRPILRDVEWTINHGEAWAVMSASSGDSGKRALFRVRLFLSHTLTFV